jgi:hypothetical protein
MIIEHSSSHWQTVWASIFRRKGMRGPHTDEFRLLDPLDRARIQANLPRLEGGELPVLASRPSPSAWCLLTTKRLFISKGDTGFNEISVKDIANARIDLEQMAARGLTKEQLSTIRITTAKGLDLQLQTDPGAPCNGLLSVLMQIARRNRSL